MVEGDVAKMGSTVSNGEVEAVVVATVLVQWAGLIYVAWPWIKGPC